MSFKIYTKTGDKGETGLFGGARIPKDHERIEAYGTVDELNAFTGALIDQIPEELFSKFLKGVQEELFIIGSHLAQDPDKKGIPLPKFPDNATSRLESLIDEIDKELPTLRNFILPGGHPAVSSAHICRTVCRRAERRVVTLGANSTVPEWLVIYLNRLSDFFFMLSRYLTKYYGASERPWVPK